MLQQLKFANGLNIYQNPGHPNQYTVVCLFRCHYFSGYFLASLVSLPAATFPLPLHQAVQFLLSFKAGKKLANPAFSPPAFSSSFCCQPATALCFTFSTLFSLSLNRATWLFTNSACPANSSLAAACSSEVAELLWVTSDTCTTPSLICAMPELVRWKR